MSVSFSGPSNWLVLLSMKKKFPGSEESGVRGSQCNSLSAGCCLPEFVGLMSGSWSSPQSSEWTALLGTVCPLLNSGCSVPIWKKNGWVQVQNGPSLPLPQAFSLIWVLAHKELVHLSCANLIAVATHFVSGQMSEQCSFEGFISLPENCCCGWLLHRTFSNPAHLRINSCQFLKQWVKGVQRWKLDFWWWAHNRMYRYWIIILYI